MPCFPCTEPLRCRFLTQTASGGVRFLTSSKIQEPLKGCAPEEKKTSEQEFLVLPNNNTAASWIHSTTHGGVLAVNLEKNNELCCVSPDSLRGTKVEPLALQKATNGEYLIQTTNGEMAVVCSDGGDVSLAFLNQSALWRMEVLSGELCFLSTTTDTNNNGKKTNNISCDLRGSLSANESFGGWQVWRLVDVPGPEGHFWINNWAHDDKILNCDGYGVVTTTALEFPVPRSAKWTVETSNKSSNKKGVLIQSVEQKGYLGLNINDGKLRTVIDPENTAGFSCNWELEPANRNSFRIVANETMQKTMVEAHTSASTEKKDNENDEKSRMPEPRYLSVVELSHKSHPFTTNMVYCTPKQQESMEWKLGYTSDERMAIQTSDAQYLAVDTNKYATSSLTLGKNPYFWRARFDTLAGVVFQGQAPEERSFLALAHGSDLPTALQIESVNDDKDKSNKHTWVWALVPCMPDKGMNLEKVKRLSLYGLVAATGAVAGPAVAMLGVGALGFGAGGITAAGGTAGVVAAEASAAGLGVLGTTVAAGAGASGAVRVATAAVNKSGEKGDDTAGATSNADISHPNRPFAGWREWES